MVMGAWWSSIAVRCSIRNYDRVASRSDIGRWNAEKIRTAELAMQGLQEPCPTKWMENVKKIGADPA
jgi:hypothetical protein